MKQPDVGEYVFIHEEIVRFEEEEEKTDASFETASVICCGLITGERQITVVLLMKIPWISLTPFFSVVNLQAINPDWLSSNPLPVTVNSVPHEHPVNGLTEANCGPVGVEHFVFAFPRVVERAIS